jgi:hypothetical protein
MSRLPQRSDAELGTGSRQSHGQRRAIIEPAVDGISHESAAERGRDASQSRERCNRFSSAVAAGRPPNREFGHEAY